MNAMLAAPAAGGSGSGGPPRYYRVGEVALMFGVSRRHIYQLCDRGEIPHIRVGRSIRFSEAHLDEYHRRAGPASRPPAA